MDLGSVTTSRLSLSSRKDAIALQDLCAETVTAPFRAPELFDPPSQCTIDESTDIWYAFAIIENIGRLDAQCTPWLFVNLHVCFANLTDYAKSMVP